MRHPKRLAQSFVRGVRGVKGLVSGEQFRKPVPKPFEKALFNFTVDFELAWGNGDIGQPGRPEPHSSRRRLESGLRQSQNFGPFLELLKELGFPISWAVLGVLADPDRIPRESAERFSPEWMREWYELPPELRERPEAWDGRPYLRRILEECPDHEILSHGHAHIDYSDRAATSGVVAWDLDSSREALTRFGFEVEGFVFPCNRHRHAELLPAHGYRIARGPDLDWHFLPEQVHTPVGFWVSPGMMSWRELKSALQEGIRSRSFIHPWMHLIECDLRCGDLKDFYRPLFETVLEEQEKGRLRNVAFRELGDSLLSGPP